MAYSLGWFNTKRVGYYEDDGQLIYCHNEEYIIKFREHSFSPLDVEDVLSSHSEVEAAVVVKVKDASSSLLLAVIQKKKDSKVQN